MLVLPGIIAWHMHQRGIITVPFKGDPSEGVLASDMAYPLLIKAVLPSWMTGFFGAVMFGAVLSSFNSGLNSLSTLFSIDIYKEMIHKEASDQQIVKAGKIFGSITIVVCIMIAPLIGKADGLYTLMRTIMAVINVPIFAVLLMGILSKRAPALSAYIMLPIGMAFFYIAHFIMDDDFGFIKIHWLHTAGFNLVIICTGMYIISKIKPQATAFQPQDTGEVDTTSWSLAALSSWVIFGLLALLYVVLSPWGLLA
jgi:SSS family solute:Na+ symporter